MKNAASELVLDLRTTPPRLRHPEIFRLWSSLREGESLLLINDHDPISLYHQFSAEHPGEFHWSYENAGPLEWRIRLRRGNFPDPGFRPASRTRQGCRPGISLKPLSNYQEIMRAARNAGLIADLHLPLEGGKGG